jgi:hypothetical protein
MPQASAAASKPLGVIDALQRGFNLINRHLWLLLPPLVVDIFLWRGPRLSIAPLIDRQFDLLAQQAASAVSMPAEATAMLEGLRQSLLSFNLFSLLAGIITTLPSYLSRLDAAAGLGEVGTVMLVADARTASLYAAMLIPIGLLIGSLWLALMVRSLSAEADEAGSGGGKTTPAAGAENAAAERQSWGQTMRRMGWTWLNLSLYLAALFAVTFVAAFLFVIVMAVLVAVAGANGVALASVAWLIFVWAVLWVGIGLSFVVSAIVLDGVNVARAAWRSFNVVGRNLTATIGLLILSFVLTEGFARIWLLLSGNSWGVPIGMVGYAYIGAALTAATLFFYRARYQHWQRARSAVSSARRTSADEFPTQQ